MKCAESGGSSNCAVLVAVEGYEIYLHPSPIKPSRAGYSFSLPWWDFIISLRQPHDLKNRSGELLYLAISSLSATCRRKSTLHKRAHSELVVFDAKPGGLPVVSSTE